MCVYNRHKCKNYQWTGSATRSSNRDPVGKVRRFRSRRQSRWRKWPSPKNWRNTAGEFTTSLRALYVLFRIEFLSETASVSSISITLIICYKFFPSSSWICKHAIIIFFLPIHRNLSEKAINQISEDGKITDVQSLIPKLIDVSIPFIGIFLLTLSFLTKIHTSTQWNAAYWLFK